MQTAVCNSLSSRFFGCVQCIFSDVVELMRCEELHAILHLVLQAGNIMNAVSPCCYGVDELQKSAMATSAALF